MDKNATLAYLYGLQMFGIKLGLDNIRQLLQAVGNPQECCQIVHVAGTNGKGSVCAFLQTLFMRAGYRVGTYTSPHLHRFNERITVDNRQISDADLVELVNELRSNNPGLTPTFFEFATALALLYFARQQVDIVVLEVGMGGRLDATNVVAPLVSVITPISYDHTDYLGADLAQIALQKGGIIKHGVPVVIAQQPPEVLPVLLSIADCCSASAYCYGRDFWCVNNNGSLVVTTPQTTWCDLQPSLLGQHQEFNLATALMTLQCLTGCGYGINSSQILDAIAHTTWAGRLEWWANAQPPILLDGAHNEAGASALAAYLSTNGYVKIRWVGGFKFDKDISAIVSALGSLTQKFYAVEPPVEQPYPNQELVTKVADAAVAVQCFADVAAAVDTACRECVAGEIVVVAGSLFLVAACREYLSNLR